MTKLFQVKNMKNYETVFKIKNCSWKKVLRLKKGHLSLTKGHLDNPEEQVAVKTP